MHKIFALPFLRVCVEFVGCSIFTRLAHNSALGSNNLHYCLFRVRLKFLFFLAVVLFDLIPATYLHLVLYFVGLHKDTTSPTRCQVMHITPAQPFPFCNVTRFLPFILPPVDGSSWFANCLLRCNHLFLPFQALLRGLLLAVRVTPNSTRKLSNGLLQSILAETRNFC